MTENEPKKTLIVVPELGTSRDQDMAQRDELAGVVREIVSMGGPAPVVTLHANLDDDEIRRAVARYSGIPVRFELATHDSAPQQRADFQARWIAAGGPPIDVGKPEPTA